MRYPFMIAIAAVLLLAPLAALPGGRNQANETQHSVYPCRRCIAFRGNRLFVGEDATH